jgi:hypothetical protein
LDAGVIEFLALESHQGKLPLPGLASLGEFLVPPAKVADAVRGVLVFLSLVGEAAEGIQEFELICGLEKRVTFTLPVDIDQHFADAFERGDCYRHFVDECRTAA